MTSSQDHDPSDETDETVGSHSAPPPADSSASFHPGDLLADRYRIESFLARGGMGEVYRALDVELGVAVALKTIRPEIAADPAALRSFKQEVLTARSVTHSNVCRIYDLWRHHDDARDVSFLTMEFLPGETLSSRLRSGGKLNGAEALPIVRQLADGLDAAHRAGIVHRDFKSANVILAPGKGAERIVITDFGLAMAAEWTGDDVAVGGAVAILSGDTDATVDSLDPRGAQICGTPAYMAPEQVRGERVGPAADLYALGVTLFEMRTGQLPFRGRSPLETAQLRLTTPPPRPSSIAELEPEWEVAILRLLSLDPAERFASAGEAAQSLVANVNRADGAPAALVSPSSRPRHSLPAEHDAFVGRRDVLSSLSALLEPAPALVTLLGIGGTGKTRLARRYGWESLERWPGGVWFCDLADARDGNGIASAVAAALGVSLTRGDPVDQLGHAIAGRGRALLILDNFEQITAEAEATLGRWRARARETSFLVTTRERLQLGGESVVEVEPLDPETEAVELFRERARAQRPGFEVTDENRAAVIEIVRLLDGLPLAIELAASRVRLLSLEQLRERLGDRFAVLASSKRGRHGTLRAALDWSWSLLTAWEQSAVAQASVFQGGFTLEAAEAVIDLSGFEDAPMVLDVIQSLVDKSWLRARVVLQAPRFSMYTTVQEYAAEKETAELRSAVTAHGAYFATKGAEKAITALSRRGGVARRAALRVELDNLIAACRAALAAGNEQVAGLTYVAAAHVLALQGPAGASVELGLNVLGVSRDPTLRARVLSALSFAERAAGKMRAAQLHCEDAVAIYRAAGARSSEGDAILSLGTLCFDQARMDEARSHMEAALTISREGRIRNLECGSLQLLGLFQRRLGQSEQARSNLEASLAIAREKGYWRFEAAALGNLGMILRDLGRFEESRSAYEATIAIHRETGERGGEGITLGNLGALQAEQGRTSEATSSMEKALAISREVGERRFEGHVIGSLGTLYVTMGRLDEARVSLEAALAIHRETNSPRGEGDVRRYLASLSFREGRLEEARAHFEASLAIQRTLGDRIFEGVTLGLIGSLLVESGQPAEARRFIDDGIAVLREVGDRLRLATGLCHLCSLELEEGNLDAARTALAEAEEISGALEVGESDLERDVAKLREALRKKTEA